MNLKTLDTQNTSNASNAWNPCGTTPVSLRTAWQALAAALSLGIFMMLTGCSIAPKTERASQFDLGTLPATSGAQDLPALPPVSIADVSTPNWLDRPLMFYRLNYDDPLQPRPYASSRWTMAPAQMIAQRIKQRITQAGGIALAASDGANNIPVLRIEADDFSQAFDAPDRSAGQIALRASVYQGRRLLGQKTVTRSVPARTADATGGARALSEATDAAARDLILWMATLPLKQ
jgi:cholesterol transport system auxiliary component